MHLSWSLSGFSNVPLHFSQITLPSLIYTTLDLSLRQSSIFLTVSLLSSDPESDLADALSELSFDFLLESVDFDLSFEPVVESEELDEEADF